MVPQVVLGKGNGMLEFLFPKQIIKACIRLILSDKI
jgi:hypothetical protein